MRNKVYLTGYLAAHFEKGFSFIMKGSPLQRGGNASNDMANFVVSVDSGVKGNDGKSLYQTIYCTSYGAQARMLYQICTMPFEQRKALPSMRVDISGNITFGYAGFDNEKQRSILIPSIKVSCDDVSILDSNYKLLAEGVYSNQQGQQGQQPQQNGMYNQPQQNTNPLFGNNTNFNYAQGQNNIYQQPQQPIQQPQQPIQQPQQNPNPANNAFQAFDFDMSDLNFNFNGNGNGNQSLADGVKGI